MHIVLIGCNTASLNAVVHCRYPHYVNKLTLPDKLTPRSGPSSARSTLQGWGGSASDRSHYSGGATAGRKLVSFAGGETSEKGQAEETPMLPQSSQREGGEVQDEEIASPGRTNSSEYLYLDLIEEETNARGQDDHTQVSSEYESNKPHGFILLTRAHTHMMLSCDNARFIHAYRTLLSG